MTTKPDATATTEPDANTAPAPDATATPRRSIGQAISEWLQQLSERPLAAIITIFILTLFIWLFGGITTAHHWPPLPIFNFGKLDDLENTFAPVNAFFTGISGIGLIVTICLQIIGMRLLKEDSKENQNLLNSQLEHAKNESKASQELLNKQIEQAKIEFAVSQKLLNDQLEHAKKDSEANQNLLSKQLELSQVEFLKNQININKQLEQAKAEFTTNRTESFFFELLKIHRENLLSNEKSGADAKSIIDNIQQEYKRFKQHIKNGEGNIKDGLTEDGRRILNCAQYGECRIYHHPDTFTTHHHVALKLYSEMYTKNKNRLSSYFRHLYHTIKYVSTVVTDEQSRKWYMQLIRAQLDTYEQALLLYNAYFYYLTNKDILGANVKRGSNEENARAFMTLIEKHHLLHEMDKNLLTHHSLADAYKDSAFNTPSPTEEPSHGDANA